MDNRMKEKIRDGRLTRDDVRRMIDWQLTLESEKIDSNLLGECLLFLYPQEPALRPEDKKMLWNRIKAAAFGTSRVHRRQQHHSLQQEAGRVNAEPQLPENSVRNVVHQSRQIVTDGPVPVER